MKRKCWCGSQLDYHDCHEAFDKKLKQYKKHGYLIPNHKMIKNEKQIEAIKRAAVVNNGLLDYIEEHIQIGMTTQDIDDMAVAYTSSHGGYSADLNYEGYPKSICTSVNDEVCHGIPGDYVLQDGDIINVDATTGVNGYYADASRMFMLGHVSEEAQRLVKVTKECLEEGMKADLCAFDLNKEYTIKEEDLKSKACNTPFLGWKVKGELIMNIVDGQLLVEE